MKNMIRKTEAEGGVLVTEEVMMSEAEIGEYATAGIYGDDDRASMEDRQRRTQKKKVGENYRECISCERCANSIEIRKFMRDQKTVKAMMYCSLLEDQAEFGHTCDSAYKNKSGRRKVIWDLENAPPTFGLEESKYKIVKGGELSRVYGVEERQTTYIGGGKEAKERVRELGNGQKGSGVMPRGLVN